MTEKPKSCKRIVLEFLDYLKYKIENDKLTMSDIDSITRAIESGLDVSGTIGEIAEFYGKSKDAVNGVIKRNYMGKPKRNVVTYSFQKFQKVAPKSWNFGSNSED